jgi:hypothetical protein
MAGTEIKASLSQRERLPLEWSRTEPSVKATAAVVSPPITHSGNGRPCVSGAKYVATSPTK